MIYEYYKNGKWVKKDKPTRRNQYGFFATRKDGTYGEVHWGDGTIVKRAYSKQSLFGWLHDNVPIPTWGDIGIKKVEG